MNLSLGTSNLDVQDIISYTCWWFSEFYYFVIKGITKRFFDAFQSCFSVLTGIFDFSRKNYSESDPSTARNQYHVHVRSNGRFTESLQASHNTT